MKKKFYLTIICGCLISLTTYGQACKVKHATLPYNQGFENTWLNFCGSDNDAPDTSWMNSDPEVLSRRTIGWRRSDYSNWGVAIGMTWGDKAFAPYPLGSSYSARFHTCNTQGTKATGSSNLDLYIDCSTGGVEVLTFYYNNDDGEDYLTISLSTDSGNTFTQQATYKSGDYTGITGWAQYTLSINSNSPQTVIRFTGTSVFGSNGSTDIGLDDVNIYSPKPCSGAPVPNAVSATQTYNYGIPYTSILYTTLIEATGITYQWQSSPDSVTWTNIPGATNLTDTANVDVTTYYRINETCTNSNSSSASAGIKLQFVPYPVCAGKPVLSAVSATDTFGCSVQQYSSILSVAAPALELGLFYQWQSSPDSVNWTDIPGATNTSDTVTVSATIYYRVDVVCKYSGQGDTSAGIKLRLIPEIPSVATLPYFQGFENWIGTCYNYDRPDKNWVTTPIYSENSWRRDDQGADAGWAFPISYGPYSPASTEGAHSARFHSSWADYYPIYVGDMDLHIDLSTPGIKQLSFDYINTYGRDSLSVLLSTDGGHTFTWLGSYTTAPKWTQELLNITSTAANAVIRLEATGDGSDDIGVDSFNIYTLPACSGTPAAGTISATTSFGCTINSYNSVLSISTTASGLTYQWQSSPDSINWTNISGATDLATTVTVDTTTYYRVYVICTGSSTSDTTAGYKLQLTPVVPVTATLPFFEGFENWIGGCYNYDRPGINWVTNPTYGDNSWRRDDQGADAGWDGNHQSLPSADGTHSARFHASTSGGSLGAMDLYVDLSAAGTKVISFDYFKNSDSADVFPPTGHLTVLISTDGSTFTPIDTFYTAKTWTSETMTTTATSSKAVIRFLAIADYNSDIAIDNLNVYVSQPCTGTPAANMPSAIQTTGCSPFSTILSTVPIMASGISYQWQSSYDSVNWVNVPGATSTVYKTPFISVNTYYRVKVICANSSLSNSSAGIQLRLNPSPSVATLPYFQGFENWRSGCFLYDRPDSNWTTIPSSSDSSWRREDQGADALWDRKPTSYTPIATEGSHAAYFLTSNGNGGVNNGSMDLHVNLGDPAIKYITFDYINPTGLDSLTVLLSTDRGLTFKQLGRYLSGSFTGQTGWAREEIAFTDTASYAIIRFQGNQADGGTDIAIDSLNIILLPPCSGQPLATTPVATHLFGCPPSFTSVLSVPMIPASGISYQWQSSPDNINWTSIAGATAHTDTVNVTATTFYRIYVVCAGSGFSDTSAGIKLNIAAPVFTTAALPFFEGFENWIGSCYFYDRPGINWTTNPSYGDSSWRRDDQGLDAGWNSAGYGYDPVSTEGSHSARFYKGEGNMDLHINLSTPGIKYIYFDLHNYNISADINGNVIDIARLQVLLSGDGGNTFTVLDSFGSNFGWTPEVTATTDTFSNAIIRFQASGGNNIGIDSLSIYAVPCTSYISRTLTASGPLDFCQTGGLTAFVTLSADATTGNRYKWLMNGNIIDGAYSSFYTVRQPGVYSVTLNNYTVTGTCSDTSVTDTVVVYPLPTPVIAQAGKQLTTGSYTTYQWYRDGQALPGATSQSDTVTDTGIYYVIVTDSNGCSNQSAIDTVYTLTSGVPALSGLQQVSLYPDPNTGDFIVKGTLNNISGQKLSFEVTNVVGQAVYKSNETAGNGVLQKHIILGNGIANGIYLLRINAGMQSQVIRFTVSR